jgi:hypothetical protein
MRRWWRRRHRWGMSECWRARGGVRELMGLGRAQRNGAGGREVDSPHTRLLFMHAAAGGDGAALDFVAARHTTQGLQGARWAVQSPRARSRSCAVCACVSRRHAARGSRRSTRCACAAAAGTRRGRAPGACVCGGCACGSGGARQIWWRQCRAHADAGAGARSLVGATRQRRQQALRQRVVRVCQERQERAGEVRSTHAWCSLGGGGGGGVRRRRSGLLPTRRRIYAASHGADSSSCVCSARCVVRRQPADAPSCVCARAAARRRVPQPQPHCARRCALQQPGAQEVAG